MERLQRGLLAMTGLLGACGVTAAAMASHGEAMRNVAAISTMALAHAPVLLILALAGKGRALLVASTVLALGVLLFVGDLAMRQWVGMPLFPGAAPLGGGALILGWLGIAFTSLVKN